MFKSVLIFILKAVVLLTIFKMFSDMLNNSKKFYMFLLLKEQVLQKASQMNVLQWEGVVVRRCLWWLKHTHKSYFNPIHMINKKLLSMSCHIIIILSYWLCIYYPLGCAAFMIMPYGVVFIKCKSCVYFYF